MEKRRDGGAYCRVFERPGPAMRARAKAGVPAGGAERADAGLERCERRHGEICCSEEVEGRGRGGIVVVVTEKGGPWVVIAGGTPVKVHG
jgi:hypothetical protein